MQDALLSIRAELLSHSNRNHHDFLQTMVPGKQVIIGVKTPVMNELARKWKAGSFSLAEALWKSGVFEEKIIAVKILEKTGKQNPDKLLLLLNRFSKSINNWAECDALGMQFLHSIRKTHGDEIFAIARQMKSSANPWQRRLSLVMVEWYTREPLRHPVIRKLITALKNDQEYYVKKAVSWLERNLSKRK